MLKPKVYPVRDGSLIFELHVQNKRSTGARIAGADSICKTNENSIDSS